MTSLCYGLFVAAAFAAGQTPERFEFTQPHMGMPFRIVLYAPGEDSANAAADAAYARIRQLDRIMNDYDPESELMRLCATAGQEKAVPVSADLLTVLTRAQTLSELSDGAFDVSVGPVVRLWRKARRTRRFPPPDEVDAALKLVDYRNIHIDARRGTVELMRSGMQLDLGGIGAGYAVDEALNVLRSRGIASALIDASGDIGVSDAPPGRRGWRIGVAPLEADADPSRFLVLKNAAVTTSGDAFQFVEFDGKRYSHIVNPKTGLGLTDRSSVTVIARDCTTADSYTKAVIVLGNEKGLRLIEATPDAAAIVVREAAGKVEAAESKRLPKYLDPEAKSQRE